MKLQSSLTEEAREKLEQVGKADILVGIPSYNNERTIGQVVKAVQCGLAKYFPNHKAMIMNSDGGSTDRTREIVKQTSIYTDLDTILVEHPVYPARSLAAPYHGLPGKGSAFKAIFEMAYELDVSVCVVVDSDLRSITPEWIQLLAGPVLLKGYDYVAPYYARHKYDGTITNSIVYPLTRCLYGRRIRQPIGGDFGFSRKILESFLDKDVWGTDVARYGIDIWMTTIAINEGFKICQSFLGAKIHDAKDPSHSLGPMFKQVVGTLFYLMIQYENNWKNVRGSRPTAMYGFPVGVFPEPVEVNVELMIEKFKAGVEEHRKFWSSFLPGDTLRELEKVALLSRQDFNFPSQLWVKIIYDFAVAYKVFSATQEEENPSNSPVEKVVSSLVPIYFGRTASFVLETKDMSTSQAEEVVEKVCLQFEEMKPYLIERWFKE
ncbi:hypothetical protein H5U35_07010, partial [Candidatus Aerophobetes bacterium]|nr:hypothetical protein [Candidatus Aerophobetes bacterium]